LPDSRIEFLVGAGTHRAPTPEEVVRIVGAVAARRVSVGRHDAYDASSHTRLGTTSRGTPVEINRRLLEADRVILVGAIGLHYVAGFSGGRKGLLPGCGSDRAIQANHLLAFDRATLSKAPGIESGRLEGNPVSEDMEEACRLLGPTFLVNTVLNGSNRLVALYAGDWYAAHRRGCADYLAAHSVSVAERRPLVVVSCGGAPRDVNMIQSHKALEHARVVLQDGGDLVLLAECAEGLGRSDFLDWFVPGGAQATARRLVEGYRVYGQTAWGIRWKSERYQVRLVSSLAPEVVRRMGMIPHASLAEALASAKRDRGYIIPQGLGTLPVLSEPLPRRATAVG
jgi:nickel-dependent lactate racemase